MKKAPLGTVVMNLYLGNKSRFTVVSMQYTEFILVL